MKEASSSSSAPCQLPPLDKVYEQYGGRGPEAQELQQWLSKLGSRVAAVVAEGGMGKTCLAVDVAWRLWRGSHATAGVLYVDCRGAFSRDALLLKLRAAAGVTSSQGDTEALAAALAKLCDGDPAGGRLLVLVDNAEDPAAADGGAALAEVLAALLMCHSRVQLLLTSRGEVHVQHMPPPHTHRIQPLGPGTAAELVLRLAQGVLSGQEAGGVAEACGCVPLALRLVSEALVAGRLTLEDVQQAVAERAAAGDDGSNSSSDPTLMFVEMVLRSLHAGVKKVALQVAAFTGSFTAASACSLLGGDSASLHEVRAHLASLHRYSVLLQHGDDSFAMHMHVRGVARSLLQQEAPAQLQRGVRERFARYVAALLARWQRLHADGALKLMVAEVAENWADVEQFLADVAGAEEEGAAGARPLLPGSSPLALSPQLLRETQLLATLSHGDFLYAVGKTWMSPTYLALTQRLVEVTQAPLQQAEAGGREPEREERLAAAAALLVRCEALMYGGEYCESAELAQRAVGLAEVAGGRGSVECAAALHLAASCLQGQGRGAEAVPLFREALAARRELLGPAHPLTTATLTHLAMQLSAEGQHEEAEGMYRQVYEAHQGSVGASHNLTAQAASNLAGCLHEQGRLAEAEALFRAALAAYRDSVGSGHRQVAFALVGLAAVVRERGQREAAEE
ncbi:hypothetical protein Agub_g10331, partial [Astrephomene gubernaculifera]